MTKAERNHWISKKYNKEIRRLPSNFFSSISGRELGEMVRYGIESILGYTDKGDIVKVSRTELMMLGFTRIIQGCTHFGNMTTYDLLSYAYPSLEPWEVDTKPGGTFDDIDNIMKVIHFRYGNCNFTYRSLSKYIHHSFLSEYFDSLDEIKSMYTSWRIQMDEIDSGIHRALIVYNDVLLGRLSKFPKGFWQEMTYLEIRAIIKYAIENILELTNKYDIYNYTTIEKLKQCKIAHLLNGDLMYDKANIYRVDRSSILEFVYPCIYDGNIFHEFSMSSSNIKNTKDSIFKITKYEMDKSLTFSLYDALYKNGLVAIVERIYPNFEDFRSEYTQYELS